MEQYIIKRAKAEDIERIQELSQELIVYEKEKTGNNYMTSLDWALTKDGYENYKKILKMIGYLLYVIIKK